MAYIDWPALPSGEIPAWDEQTFMVDGAAVPFISYSQNLSGWDDELTSLHNRESAGTHPIDVTSRHHALAAIKQFHRSSLETVLEVGSSEGILLRELRAAFPRALVVGSEVAPGALKRIASEQSGIPLLQMDIVSCPLPPEIFNAVVALNVIEHIQNDSAALKSMARLLKPNGTIVIEVPAGPGLYDAYDKELRHYRRYSMSDLKTKIEGAGLKIIKKTHVGFYVYPMFAAIKKWNRMQDKGLNGREVVRASIQQTKNRWVIRLAFTLENKMFSTISFPFGIRCLIVAAKFE